MFTQVQAGSLMCAQGLRRPFHSLSEAEAISLMAAGFAFSLPETAGEELSAASEVEDTVYADSDLSDFSSD